jgi:prevent-host-death family protein
MKMSESRFEVDVADLQHSLRECIERVRSGEHVTVTDGGHPVARLSPIEESGDRLAELIGAGVVRAPRRKVRRRPAPRIQPNGPVSDFIGDQRR